MCGIAGFLDPHRTVTEVENVVWRMASPLTHRGPDDGGIWADHDAGVGLGHRRLSVIDLSPEGRQPMVSASGRYVLVYNGEIYNHSKIREELDRLFSPCWRGHSDTETMLEAFDAWGVRVAVGRFVGMFAFALWDRRDRALYLVRDRLGEKPLYYGWAGDLFLFGSELKALRAHPAWTGEIDTDALALYFRHNYIPAPYSIYRGIRKLVPGSILRIKLLGDRGREPGPELSWSAKEVAERGVADPFPGSTTEALSRLETLLLEAIGQEMIADVPLGALLSGGIDSSAVVALMQSLSVRPVKTFTIGFHEAGYNEAVSAKAVADHLGTDHTELYVTPREAMDVVPLLPTLYDEPFSDSSQIPTFLVSRLTRRHVTVALSGDAGDELFGGYTRYLWGRSIWRKIAWMPIGLRSALRGAITAVSPERWDSLIAVTKGVVRGRQTPRHAGDQFHKLAELLLVKGPEELYLNLVSHWKNPCFLVPGAVEPPTVLSDRKRWADLPDFVQRMMFLDTVTYLPDDILVKVDRASMGVSLECRVPFLDHRIVEFAWHLPLSMKIRGNQGKWLLRQLLYKYVPRALVERPKTGFGVPIDSWLRGPLREWAESLLYGSSITNGGIIDPSLVREKWREHLSGARNWQYYLWDVLMFQAWLDQNRAGIGQRAVNG
jgi:asparagine synthase (glutamine-hydrolysing)